MAKRDSKKLGDEEIRALLWEQVDRIRQDNASKAATRALILEYYQGMLNDLPAPPNRSGVTSNDIRDIVGWMLPGIMRTFTSSGRVVDYIPSENSDEGTAEQASDWMTNAFMSRNEGYRIIYESAHDSLLHGQGIIKCWWDEDESTVDSVHEGLTVSQTALLLRRAKDAEVLEATQYEGEGIDEETGQPGIVPLVDIRLRRRKNKGRIRFDVIAPEDFGISGEATDVPEARLCYHRSWKTRSELQELGYKLDKLSGLGTTRLQDDPEALAREGDSPGAYLDDAPQDASTLVEVYECYAKLDVDGDGILEQIYAVLAGSDRSGQLLYWEEWEEEQAPFFPIPCEPLPHRFDGLSLAEQIIDMMRLKTQLMRQAVDNSYSHNNPQPVIEEGSIVNRDSLLAPKFGQPIVVRRGTARDITWKETPSILPDILAMIEYCDQVIERRTGVSRMMMALDPEVLQNQSATANQNARDASYSKTELVARNMAEYGFKLLFRYALKLAHKYVKGPEYLRLRDEYVPVDPAYWDADMDATVNVGLGTGSRDRDAMMLSQMLGTQTNMAMMLTQTGMGTKAVEFIPKIRDTAVKIAEAAGIRNADAYYPSFTDEEVDAAKKMAAQPPQDPKLQIEQQKLQMEVQIKAADLRIKQLEVYEKTRQKESELMIERMKARMEIEAKRQIEGQKLVADIAKEKAQMSADIAVQRDKLQNDIVLKREEMAMKERLEREKIAKAAEMRRTMKVKRGKDGKAESIEMGGV
jgi:hypothetical protein